MSTVPTTVKEDDTLEIELQLAVSLFSVAPSPASCGCWGLNLGPRQEQCVLLASEPSLWLLSHTVSRHTWDDAAARWPATLSCGHDLSCLSPPHSSAGQRGPWKFLCFISLFIFTCPDSYLESSQMYMLLVLPPHKKFCSPLRSAQRRICLNVGLPDKTGFQKNLFPLLCTQWILEERGFHWSTS